MPRSSRSGSSRPLSRYNTDRARPRTRTRSRSPGRARSRSRSRSSSRSTAAPPPRRPPPTGPAAHQQHQHPHQHTISINRQLTTPFLLHLCYRSNAFHGLADFQPHHHLPAHLQIYTWMSCTLRELAQLLATALPGILPQPAAGTRLAFRLVYPDTAGSASKAAAGGRLGGGGGPDGAEDGGRGGGGGRYVSREMGSVVVGAAAAAAGDAPASASPDDRETNKNGAHGNASNAAWDLGGDEASKTLDDVRFVIGDFVDCAIFPPLSDGSVVARSTAMGYGYGNGNGLGGGGGRRELNGFGRGPPRGGGSGGGGGYGRVRAGVGSGAGGENVPSGEWRRGERLPDRGIGGGGGGGNYGRARTRY